jgi:signal transduction histidine kinase
MTSQDFADDLGRKYRLALLVVTGLVVGNQALVQLSLIRLTTDAPRINLAGRQRMLSQRLAKAALLLERGGARAEAAHEEIESVLGLWAAANERLLDGENGFAGVVGGGMAVRDGLAALQPHFVAMRDAARQIHESRVGGRPSAPSEEVALSTILDHESDYLRLMDRVVGLYEAEAQGRLSAFRTLGWALTGIILAALAAIGRFILRPAGGLIRQQVAELGRARDELEARVRERTGELEAARERHRALLEQYSHAGRVSAAGEMASSLAHELNQPLGAIANYAEGCLIALEAPAPALNEVRDALRRIRETTLRAGRILDRVRRFVTRQGAAREAFDANQAVRDAVEILGNDARRRGATIELELAPGLPCLWGDPVQIQQVLVNLVRNSLDALDASQTPGPEVVIWTLAADEGGVELGVSDNGEGVPAECLGQIFDAYFSTRAGGMGMGLAISRTIVEAHQGKLLVASEPGVRTTFRFRLPPAPTEHERADGLHRG